MTVLRLISRNGFQPERLFRPRSLAVIGAPTSARAQLQANMEAGGFTGAVSIAAAVADLAAPPDLAVLTDDGPVTETLDALAALGCHAGVAIGMAEGIVRQGSPVRVFGPGSFGLAVPEIGLNATRGHMPPPRGRIALMSQSAALCRAVVDWAGPNGVGFSHIVGVGGGIDLGSAAALDWLSRDSHTNAILMDIRTVRNPRGFISAARAAARLRPVVALRAGGRVLDPSGEADAVFEAALRRAGILTVTSLEELLAAAETLSRSRRRAGAGLALAVVTNAIGPGLIAADTMMREGLALAQLGTVEQAALRTLLPVQTNLRDCGIVYTGVEDPIRLSETAAVVAASPGVGGVLVVHAPTGPRDAAAIQGLIACASSLKVPLLVASMGESTGAGHRASLAAAGIPAFALPEQAVRGFSHLAQDARNRAAARELPAASVLPVEPDKAAVHRVFGDARRAGRRMLAQDEALAVLAAYGVPIAVTLTADDVAGVTRAAGMIGYPVAVKLRAAVAPGDVGAPGLALDLHDDAALSEAARRALRLGLHPAPGETAPILPMRLLVQAQAPRGRELEIRVFDDPMLGTAISFGQGGSQSRAFQDLAYDLPPLNLTLARGLIARTRVARSFGASHDAAAVDPEAIAGILVRVSQLIVDFPQIAALDINPLIAAAAGVTVVGAAIALHPEGVEDGRLAISPYPARLEQRFHNGGEMLILRPIRPEDAAAHRAFFNRVPAEDIRLRFFSPLRELSPEVTARMTQVDYDREIAFIAVRPATQETVGVSRLVREGGGDQAEFAVIVQPDVKGHGLASRLMHCLFDWARERGILQVNGQILADNAPMIAFARRLGFSIHRMAESTDVVEARLSVLERPD